MGMTQHKAQPPAGCPLPHAPVHLSGCAEKGFVRRGVHFEARQAEGKRLWSLIRCVRERGNQATAGELLAGSLCSIFPQVSGC